MYLPKREEARVGVFVCRVLPAAGPLAHAQQHFKLLQYVLRLHLCMLQAAKRAGRAANIRESSLASLPLSASSLSPTVDLVEALRLLPAITSFLALLICSASRGPWQQACSTPY